MRSVTDHARIIVDLLSPMPAVSVPLDRALGLVLAEDLVAGLDLPPFANSAMDGYAVHADDVARLPTELPVSQDIPAGRADVQALIPGTAARIMTGAPVPRWRRGDRPGRTHRWRHNRCPDHRRAAARHPCSPPR